MHLIENKTVNCGRLIIDQSFDFDYLSRQAKSLVIYAFYVDDCFTIAFHNPSVDLSPICRNDEICLITFVWINNYVHQLEATSSTSFQRLLGCFSH